MSDQSQPSPLHNDRLRRPAPRGPASASRSPFDSGRMGELLSCFACGRHKPRRGGLFRRLIGKNQFICSQDCLGALLKRPASA